MRRSFKIKVNQKKSPRRISSRSQAFFVFVTVFFYVSVIRLKIRMRFSEYQRLPETMGTKIKYLSSLRGPLNLERSTFKYPFDILSIGSSIQLGLLHAQASTFGHNTLVGYFVAATENDDANPWCAGDLSLNKVVEKLSVCKMRWKENSRNPLMSAFRKNIARKQWLEKKKNPVGWYCAQSRPPLALAKLLRHYRLSYEKNGEKSLPLYLLLIDDDTYIDMGILHQYLFSFSKKVRLDNEVSPHEPVVYAGCRIRWPIHEVNFTFPYGGHGLFFSRGALLRLIQPLFCNFSAVGYEKEACRRFDDESSGLSEEISLFRPGMSVGDLMGEYSASRQNCLHSDWNTGYFINFYNVSKHATADGTWFTENERMKDVKEARLHSLGSSELYNVRNPSGNCVHEGNTKCPPGSIVCHRLTAEDMVRKHSTS